MRYTIDCEFDGHGGKLLSMCLISEENEVFYFVNSDYENVDDPWVAENVVPIMWDIPDGTTWTMGAASTLGDSLRQFLDCDDEVTIVADSSIDIGRFCHAVHTGFDGEYVTWGKDDVFYVVYNVDCWPNKLGEGAVQHNAYWDAKALWEKLHD